MPTLETLVIDDIPDEVTPHKKFDRNIHSHIFKKEPPRFPIKSGWLYGWNDITKYCCILKPEPVTTRNEDDYGKDGYW